MCRAHIDSFVNHAQKTKMRSMSNRNMVGTCDRQLISTIQMDTNGPMKTLGVYGITGSIRYFLSIIDDQTSRRWVYVSARRRMYIRK